MDLSFYSKFWHSKYLTLLFVLIAMLTVYPISENQMGPKLLFSIFFLLTLLGIFYGLKGKRGVLVFMAIGTIALGINFAEISFKKLEILSLIVSILFYIYAIILFCKDIYTSKEISEDVLLGSICVYLLIGISFALMYMLIQAIDAGAIINQASGNVISKSSDFYYFSFITLATVGFGDIIAHNDFAKSIVMLEGIVGIFYIAILVARLVSVFRR